MDELRMMLTLNKNDENAYYMSKYMKFKFKYFGIKTPERKSLTKVFIKEKVMQEMNWDFVFWCFSQDEREYQYIALDYLDKIKNKLVKEDINNLERLILCKSWWDTVDSIAPIVGYLAKKYPEIKRGNLVNWIESSNIWLKRASIIFQLKYKNETDYEFLSCAIKSNSDTGEFFVDKAIGWQLRELSKTNKEWVRIFIGENQLSNLSIREGSKYL